MIDFNYDVNLQTKTSTNFVIISLKTFVDVRALTANKSLKQH